MSIDYSPLNPLLLKDGYRKEYQFENGYGLSIISNPVSYGGTAGLFEIGLTHKDFDGLLYNESIGFPDVQGFLDFHDVVDVIDMVKNLPPLDLEKSPKELPQITE
jgi:hypothetical protein